jgi:sarcosine oxidase
MSPQYDLAIIGGGTMGLPAAYHAAKTGLRVLLLDPNESPHIYGSHAGRTRIIRKSYYEHSDYVPLLEDAYQQWSQIEGSYGTKIYHETGLTYIGSPSSEVIQGIREASEKYRIPLFNGVDTIFEQIPDEWQTWYEPEAGYLDVQHALTAFKNLTNREKIEFKQESLESWEPITDGFKLIANQTTYRAEKVVFCAGSWTQRLLSAYSLGLKITRQVIAWVATDKNRYEEGQFPCWFLHDPSRGMYYGFPVNHKIRSGLKLALHMPGLPLASPDHYDKEVLEVEKEAIHYFLNRYQPALSNAKIDYETCLYTYSPDDHFIVDFLPGYESKVAIACGFSGHGFKFAPTIGKILIDLIVQGNTDLPIDFLRLRRFNH